MASLTSSLRASALTMALLATAGCVTVPQPIPIAEPTNGPTVDASAIHSPDLRVAYSFAERVKGAMVDNTQKAINNRAITRTAIIGGTVASVAAMSFGGSRDLIAALAIGTGTVTGISALTGERGYVGIYSAGANAAGCVSMSIVQVDAPGKAVDSGIDTLKEQISLLNQLQQETSSVGGSVASHFDAATWARVETLNGDISRGLALAYGYSTGTSTFAGNANAVTKGIDDTVRRQIVDETPNNAEFRGIVGGLPGLTVAPAAKPATAPVAPAGGTTPPPPAPPPPMPTTPAQALARLAAIEAQIAATKTQIQTIINAAQTASNLTLASCAGKQPEVVALPLQIEGAPGNSVTLKPGTKHSLLASGGLGTFKAEWIGAVPEQLHITNGAGLPGQSFTLTADSPATDGTYQLRFSDAATAQAINIAVQLAN